MIRLLEQLNHGIDGLHVFVDVPSFILLQLELHFVIVTAAATTEGVVKAPPKRPRVVFAFSLIALRAATKAFTLYLERRTLVSI